MWYGDLNSPAPVFRPIDAQQLEEVTFPQHQFSVGTTSIIIPGDVQVVLEFVFGGSSQPNTEAASTFILLFAVALALYISVLTTASRFWFYVGIALTIMIIVSLRLDRLGFEGVSGQLTVPAIIILFAGLGFYFRFLKPETHFGTRFGCFALLTGIIGALIWKFSIQPHPFQHLAAYALIPGVIVSIIFTFTVAHEILASIVFVVTRSNRPTNSLRHFLIIAAIYMLNLGLIYADKKHILNWRFVPFDLFILVSISGILGIWGFRKREPLYKNILRADPFGVFLYVSLAIVGFATMGYLLASANDPGVQLLKDTILYAHLGYGIIFFGYVIVNFISPLGENLQVHKVLYKPAVMPYFTFRLAGLIATFAFFAYSNWRVSANQATASHYNALADLHLLYDTTRQAETQFQQSEFYATRNYHAHYSLAQIFGGRGDYHKEQAEYERLVESRPLDLAYLNLSQLYMAKKQLPQAVKSLRQGLVDFPDNGYLANALSLVYSRMGYRDSAIFFAQAAMKTRKAKRQAETNVVAFSTLFAMHHDVDSLVSKSDRSDPGVNGNLWAIAAIKNKQIDASVDPVSDTVLSAPIAAMLNNYLIHPSAKPDTALATKAVVLARRPANAYFKTFLLAAAAHTYYKAGLTRNAFKLMHEIAFLGQQSKYYDVIGLWALEQGAYGRAILYLDEAVRLNGASSYFNKAVALTEGQAAEAKLSWDSLKLSSNEAVREHAKQELRVLTASPSEAQTFPDDEKYEYSRHRFGTGENEAFLRFVDSITDPEIRAKAIIDRTRILEENDDTALAIAVFEKLNGLQFRNPDLQKQVLHMSLLFLARKNQLDALSQHLQDSISFDRLGQERVYFDALLFEKNGKKEEAARRFEFLAHANPFFEDAVIASVRFANRNGADKLKTYGVLMDALDQNPESIKLLKAYVVQAAYVEFEESAQDALDKLKTLMYPPAFAQFVNENPDIFHVTHD